MQGIKQHTREERTKVIEQLLPFFSKKFGENFVALAADGSYARNEDDAYSDLELILFLKEIPENEEINIRKVVDGMLLVVVAETKQSFIEKYKEITDIWYASGAGKLLPIVNQALIEEINNFRPVRVEEKCLRQVQKRWAFYQEISAKVLNNCKQKNKEALALSFSAMVKETLVILSFLNATAYITLGSYISQAQQFTIKPQGFDALLVLFIKDNYQDFSSTEKAVKEVFSDLETILQKKGLALYAKQLL